MTLSIDSLNDRTLTLPEELILMLLNEESGYFHQVPGWDLHCAVIGAVLAELSMIGRIDTDRDTLILLDETEVGDPELDPILKDIVEETEQHDAQYWIERLAPRAESIIDSTLYRLVRLNILEHHDGEFWTLSQSFSRNSMNIGDGDGSAAMFISSRIRDVLFNDVIPYPREVVIICLLKTCDVLRFIFQLDDEVEARIEAISKIDLIGRAITNAVTQNLAAPLIRRSGLARKIPVVSLTKLLFNPHVRSGNVPALFADMAREYGPVFELRPPFSEPMIVLAGAETNRWVHRQGRLHLRTRDYFSDFEKVYGASGVLPSLDGADHFRLRKSLSPAYSRNRLMGQMGQLIHYARKHMAEWTVGDAYPATRMCRRMINSQISPLFVSVDSQDIFDDLAEYKERALSTHIVKILPKFMLKTPGMRRRAQVGGHLAGADTERAYARAARRRLSKPRGRHSEPARERSAVLPGVEPALRAVGGADCERVSGRRIQLRAVRDGVAAGVVREDTGRGGRAVRERGPESRRPHAVLDRCYAPLPDGEPAYVPDSAGVDAACDEYMRGRGL